MNADATGALSRRAILRYTLLTGTAIAAAPAVSLLGAGPAAAAGPVFAVPNPSFELETTAPGYPDQWGFGASGSAGSGGLDRAVARSGEKSFRTVAPTLTDRYTVQLYMRPTTEGYAHRFSVWHRVEGVTGTAPALQLHFYDANRRVLASTAASGATRTADWTQLTVELAAPVGTRYLSLTLANWYSKGTVWWDDVSVETWRAVTVVGGNYLEREKQSDRLTLSVAAGDVTCELATVAAFGKELRFVDATRMRSTTGETYTWSGAGVTWDAASGTAQLAAGTQGSLTIAGGRFDPPRGVAFPTVTVAQSGGAGGTQVFLIASGFREPDHAAQRAVAPAALAAAKAGSDYLETRVVAGGGIGIGHSTWPGDVQPDPQGNASAATVNTRLWQLTGEPVYRERATRILDFLAAVQLPSGGFGFPWAYGIANSHFAYPGHYPDGKTHARGSVMAIITDNAATALVEGYHAFGTGAYLEAAKRAVGYFLHDPDGLQFLDPDEEYASIPYCSMAPVDADGGRATEVYNIDGASLLLLRKVYETTGDGSLLRYGDALARNLNRRVEADGSVPYAWYGGGKPTGYAYIVYGGLLQWGALRHTKQWIATGRRGISWMTNIDRPSAMLWEDYTGPLGGVDNTQDVINFVNATTASQRPDGSWTGGANTRSDAGNATLLAALLRQMEFTP